MNSSNIDIRWKQRFKNYRRAFKLLYEALENRDIDQYSMLELEGIIQRFEYTFELGWKTFKDYLEYSGIKLTEATPRKVIKECAARGIFSEAKIDGNMYLEMMLSRNALAHIYDFKKFTEIIVKIKTGYLQELEKEYTFFLGKDSVDG